MFRPIENFKYLDNNKVGYDTRPNIVEDNNPRLSTTDPTFADVVKKQIEDINKETTTNKPISSISPSVTNLLNTLRDSSKSQQKLQLHSTLQATIPSLVKEFTDLYKAMSKDNTLGNNVSASANFQAMAKGLMILVTRYQSKPAFTALKEANNNMPPYLGDKKWLSSEIRKSNIDTINQRILV